MAADAINTWLAATAVRRRRGDGARLLRRPLELEQLPLVRHELGNAAKPVKPRAAGRLGGTGLLRCRHVCRHVCRREAPRNLPGRRADERADAPQQATQRTREAHRFTGHAPEAG